MMVNRGPRGWNVTLVNNHGVVKQPGVAASVDRDQKLTAELSLKPGSGKIIGVHALVSGTDVTILPNGTFRVDVEAGGVEVVGVLIEDPSTTSEPVLL